MTLGALRRLWRAMLGKLLSVLPLGVIDLLAVLGWRAQWLFMPGGYWIGKARADIGANLLGLEPQVLVGVERSRVLETLLDWRMTAVRPECRNWPGLLEAAEMLKREIERLRREHPGCPVIVSPFHYVSQYVNIQVCDQLRQLLKLETLGVVSAIPYGIYGDDNMLVPNLKVFHTYDDGAKSSIGISFFKALRKDGAAVLFADASPHTLAASPAETTLVRIFGRQARIHNGVFRLGAHSRAKLLSFYLSYRNGRFVCKVFDPLDLAHPDAPQQVADQIERAIRANYSQWLQAGHPAMYWFAAAK